MKKEKAVLILSGGVDSTTLLYNLLDQDYEVYAVSFDYGQKHAKELLCAAEICRKLSVNHKILNLSVLNDVAPSALTRKDIEVPEGHYKEESMKATIVPNRNMVMLSLATAYAISIKATKLFYGAHIGDHEIYPDCRKEFIYAMKQAIKLCDWHQVELKAPFRHLTKVSVVNLGKTLNVDYSLTYSCYKGSEKACGKCGTCVERLEAFKIAGVKDPIEYEK
ncbi:hypothetical protein LCGC14_0909620 [marine sediment metagenome]|uniref:7-cyano-7-deazaguanine synthase n=1 Tax=marine sediment metagenome TaxID=412755 RepID=A0A0F9RCY3_9ZZZZ